MAQEQRTAEGTQRFYETRERARERVRKFFDRKMGGGVVGAFSEEDLTQLLVSFALGERKQAGNGGAGPQPPAPTAPGGLAGVDLEEVRERDRGCYERARAKGEPTFTLRAQDRSAPAVILHWMALNVETLSHDKLADASRTAAAMRDWPSRKAAD